MTKQEIIDGLEQAIINRKPLADKLTAIELEIDALEIAKAETSSLINDKYLEHSNLGSQALLPENSPVIWQDMLADLILKEMK